MRRNHADQGYRKFRDVWKDMTWAQRWDHFLYYYGVAALVGIAVIIMGISVLVDAFSEKPQYLFEGMTVNVRWSDEAEAAVTTELFDHLGGMNPKKQYVVANHFTLQEYSASMIESMYTRVATGEIDYILVDKFAMDALAPWGFFTDLNLILSKETMEQWKDYFVYAQEIFPIAIDISKTPFAKECTYKGDYLYLGFTGNTQRQMGPEAFMEYLFSRFDGE